MSNHITFLTPKGAFEHTEVMRITRDGVFVNPDVAVDDIAQTVLDALDDQIKALVQKAVEDEREDCARVLDEMAAKDALSNYYKVAALAIRARLAEPDLARVGEVGVWGERQWQGLTDEEIEKIEMSASSKLSAIYLVEAQLKGKNYDKS